MALKYFLDETIFNEHLFKTGEVSQQLKRLINLQASRQINCYISRRNTLKKVFEFDYDYGLSFRHIFGVVPSFDVIKDHLELVGVVSQGLSTEAKTVPESTSRLQLANFLELAETVESGISAETGDIKNFDEDTDAKKGDKDFSQLPKQPQDSAGSFLFATIGIIFFLKSVIDLEVEKSEDKIAAQERLAYFNSPLSDIPDISSAAFPEGVKQVKVFGSNVFAGISFVDQSRYIEIFYQEEFYSFSGLSSSIEKGVADRNGNSKASFDLIKELFGDEKNRSNDTIPQDFSQENSRALDFLGGQIFLMNPSEISVFKSEQGILSQSVTDKDALLEMVAEVSENSSSSESTEIISPANKNLVAEANTQEFVYSLLKFSKGEQLEIELEPSGLVLMPNDIESTENLVDDIIKSDPFHAGKSPGLSDPLEEPKFAEMPNSLGETESSEEHGPFDEHKLIEGSDSLDRPEPIESSDVLDDPVLSISVDDNSSASVIDEPKLTITERFLKVSGVSSEFSPKVTVGRDAIFESLVGLYIVDDENGTIKDDLTGQALSPRDLGYREAALSNRLGQDFSVDMDGSQVESTLVFKENAIYGLYIDVNYMKNGLNDNSFDLDSVFFSFPGANPGYAKQVTLIDPQTLGFEDLSMGDQDFNDFTLRFDQSS